MFIWEPEFNSVGMLMPWVLFPLRGKGLWKSSKEVNVFITSASQPFCSKDTDTDAH